MKKLFILFFFSCMLSTSIYSQLMVAKLLGKNGSKTDIGFGTFACYSFPLNGSENKSIRFEILDFGYFPLKNEGKDTASYGYLSIKLGYKHIFSETKSGFYLEPQAGYCRVVTHYPPYYVIDKPPASQDGIALALEGGYSLEVGQRGNNFDFGLKYETDIAGTNYTLSSVAFRVSYSFHFFKHKDNYY